jgi:flagellar biosynthesis protein FlhB
MNKTSKDNTSSIVEGKPIVQFGNATFTGNSIENKATWDILCKNKGCIIMVQVLEETLKSELKDLATFSETKQKWVSFFTYFVTFIAIYLSTDFKDFYSIDSEILDALVLFVAIIFFIFFVFSYWKYHSKKDYHSISQILKRLNGDPD